jgi:phosphoglycolate phosphatase-like HAD superfamily hydrolase
LARIALDIDSTLHHYWDLLDEVARRRYGVSLPYHEQHTWGITQLEQHELVAAVQETHTDENIEAAEPYEGAVETVREWHGRGHWIHVTSHRAGPTRAATERWLERIGMPYDDLHCSYDKVSRCVELGIDVLIDDSPVNLERALEAGIAAATIVHPWNADLVEAGRVVGGRDWFELRDRLEPVLGG